MKSEIYRNMLIVMLLTVLTILSIDNSITQASGLNESRVDQSNLPSDSLFQVPAYDLSGDLIRLDKSPSIAHMYGGPMTFEATVYNDDGYAADGTYTYEGMIAADPSVLPLGTVVYIEFPGEYSFMSGTYTVHDTGGSVYGNIVDIWVPWSHGEMYDFGRRYVTVTVL